MASGYGSNRLLPYVTLIDLSGRVIIDAYTNYVNICLGILNWKQEES